MAGQHYRFDHGCPSVQCMIMGPISPEMCGFLTTVPPPNVTCTANARNPISGSGTQTKSTTGNSSSSMVLSFTGPDVSATFTYCFYTCTLPPTTAIISYRGIAQ